MEDIKILREKINKIDEEMLKLFEERMSLSEEIYKYKKENNIKITDKKRESELITNNSRLLKQKTLKPYYLKFLKKVIKLSKSYQKKLSKEK